MVEVRPGHWITEECYRNSRDLRGPIRRALHETNWRSWRSVTTTLSDVVSIIVTQVLLLSAAWLIFGLVYALVVSLTTTMTFGAAFARYVDMLPITTYIPYSWLAGVF